jgi:hypothetical protein
MQSQKVREQPIYLGRLEVTVGDIHRSHLPMHHHPPGVKFLGDV